MVGTILHTDIYLPGPPDLLCGCAHDVCETARNRFEGYSPQRSIGN